MSNKESYYFSHDSNARQDEKLIALRMKHGWEGYGLYWALIEKLRESSEYMSVCDYNIIAYDLRTDAAKIKSIIEDFRLFSFTEKQKVGKCFYSESLKNRMGKKSEIARKNAQSRWSKDAVESKDDTTAMQLQCDGNATAMQNDAIKVKKSKVKENKEEEEKKEKALPQNFKKLTIQQFHEELKSYTSDFSKETVSAFFNYWSEKDSNGKMKFQREETWETKKRLIMWKNKEGKWKS